MEQQNVIVIETDGISKPNEGNTILENRENFASGFINLGVPLVSIVVITYNRIGKTRNCIESILKYTEDIDYELVLVDNGSEPDIMEYFQSVNHDKKTIVRITKNLEAHFGMNKGMAYANGRYLILACNDCVMTKNWLYNLIECVKSDSSIGLVSPSSLYVSNYQAVDISFTDMKDMQRKAAAFNISDPTKWHERLRLCGPATLITRECFDAMGSMLDYGFFHDFGDDDYVFKARRQGYKTMLCRDTFIHHDHQTDKGEDKNQEEFQRSLMNGRENFKYKYLGVDAWDDVNNFEITMIGMVGRPIKTSNIEILGVEVRCGTPVLELKSKLRSYKTFDVTISTVFEDPKYYVDNKAIFSGDVFCDKPENILNNFNYERFDYILLGQPINLFGNPVKLLSDCSRLQPVGGTLLLKLRNTHDARTFINILGNTSAMDKDSPIHVSIEELEKVLKMMNYKIKEIKAEPLNIDPNTCENLKQIIKKAGIAKNTQASLNKLITENYVITAYKLQ